MIPICIEETEVGWRLRLVVNETLNFICVLPAASKEDAERMAAEVAKAISTSVCRVQAYPWSDKA